MTARPPGGGDVHVSDLVERAPRWWRQNGRGYTTVIQWAGVFDEQTALGIIAGASLGEQMTARDNYGVYADQRVPNEVLVPLTVEGHPGGPDCPPAPSVHAWTL